MTVWGTPANPKESIGIGRNPANLLDRRELYQLLSRPMAKKKKTPGIPDDPLSRRAMQDGIKALREKHFAVWNPSLPEEATFQIAEGFEKIAKALRNLAGSEKLRK